MEVAQEGAQPSPAAFAERHGVELTRLAYLLVGDRQLAEDLVQDVLLALHRRFGETITADAPLAYARRALANAAISRSRRRSDVVAAEPPDRAVVDEPREQGAMWHALDSLPSRQRSVLVLRYYADLSDARIAEVLGCREGTVRSLAARAFATLRADRTLLEDR